MLLYIQIHYRKRKHRCSRTFSCSVGAFFVRSFLGGDMEITNKVKAAIVVAIISAVLVVSGILQLKGAM